MGTDTLERRAGISVADIKRFSAWGVGLLLVGAIGFAHGTLWAHETAIAVIKSEQANAAKQMEEVKVLLREMLAEMRRKP